MSGNLRRSLLTVVALAVLIVSAVGVAAVAQPEAGDVYTGCLNENSGGLRNVAVGFEPLKKCNKQETQISWDRAGPAFEELFGTLELSVDCDESTVTAALDEAETHLGPVIITILGVCVESVNVDRDDVSFIGTQRSDGIRGAVFMSEAHGISFSNMTISEGGIFADLGSTFVAFGITVRETSQSGISVNGGSSARVNSCSIIDNARFGVAASTEGVIELSACEISGSGETGVFAGGVGSASIVVVDSEIVGNAGGAGANPGGNLRISDTLVADNRFVGVFALGGVLVLDGETVIMDNEGFLGGVYVADGSNAYAQVGPVVVDGNLSAGIAVAGGSAFRGDELIVRNNGGNGISVSDLSTVTVSPAPGDTSQIINNGGWGIGCAGPPAIAVLGGQGLFNPADIDLSGNALGATNCP